MKKSLQRKIACNINLNPELNRLVLRCKCSWDEVASMLTASCKKNKASSKKTKQ